MPTPVRKRVDARNNLRAAVWDKCDGRCTYCGVELHPFRTFEVDHAVSYKAGGTDDISNLVGCCMTCNRTKNVRYDQAEVRKKKGTYWRVRTAELARLMDERGLTCNRLSTLSGISNITVANAVNGTVMPQPNTVKQLAQALNVDIWAIVEPREGER